MFTLRDSEPVTQHFSRSFPFARKNHSQNGTLFFLEGLRMMTTFLSNIEQWKGTGGGGGDKPRKETSEIGVKIPR